MYLYPKLSIDMWVNQKNKTNGYYKQSVLLHVTKWPDWQIGRARARLRIQGFDAVGHSQGTTVSLEQQERDTGIVIDPGSAAGLMDISLIDT